MHSKWLIKTKMLSKPMNVYSSLVLAPPLLYSINFQLFPRPFTAFELVYFHCQMLTVFTVIVLYLISWSSVSAFYIPLVAKHNWTHLWPCFSLGKKFFLDHHAVDPTPVLMFLLLLFNLRWNELFLFIFLLALYPIFTINPNDLYFLKCS